jgi:alpha-mannosidase
MSASAGGLTGTFPSGINSFVNRLCRGRRPRPGLKAALWAGLGLLLLSGTKLAAQESAYWPENTARWLQGYARSISGETIFYHSAEPGINSALLVRAMDEKSRIEWETEAVPDDWGDFPVTFIWLAGLAAGKGSHNFRLDVDGQPVLTFATAEDASNREFRFEGKGGAELTFQVTRVDQFGELFGYMFLKLPAESVRKSKPLRIRVVGEPSGSRDWYMTFESRLAPAIKGHGEQALVREGGRTYQLASVDVVHIGPAQRVEVFAPTATKTEATLRLGFQSLDVLCEPVAAEKTLPVELRSGGRVIGRLEVTLRPVRDWKVCLLPHSHNDIGYSDLQRIVEKNQWKYYEQAIELARKTADYPPEARFKWNVEILWAVESYLAQASEEKRREFVEAVKQGAIGLQAFFCNPLTGLFNPEELFHLTEYARLIEARYGLPINSAMISDIPGSLWSVVPALAQSGVKYYSSGPNFMPSLPDGGDRIGSSLKAWGDRPFYWVSPSGREKILFWMAGKGYSWFHGLNLGEINQGGDRPVLDYVRELEEKAYPYDMVQVRYTIGGDNGPPDADLPDFVKKWNERYESPKLIIMTAAQMFEEFEERYGGTLPLVKGDFTPYWEDGALSSAQETALNRNTANILLQAEALWAMLAPDEFPDQEFYQAWRRVVLYDEHTWGAHNSVSEPDDPGVIEQWDTKRAFAVEGDEMSSALVRAALAAPDVIGMVEAVDVYNASSWPRTDLVVLPADWSLPGNRVKDEPGNPVPSQRLSSGELAFLARAVPPLGAARYFISRGHAHEERMPVKADSTQLSNGLLTLAVDKATGAVSVLSRESEGLDFVDREAGFGLNEYFCVPGRDPKEALRAGQAKITVLEQGPLLGSLLIESDAPGSSTLVREIWLVQGADSVDIRNSFDKKKTRAKESVHFGFPLRVPGGILRADSGWGIVQPEVDQIAGACRDFLYIHDWVDVSNDDFGLTLVPRDGAIIEPGAMTDESLGARGVRRWKETTTPGQVLYAYVANNYWHTNYRADQEGWTTVRYSIRLHLKFDPAAAKRFGLEKTQPLIAVPADNSFPPAPSLFEIKPDGVVLTSLRTSRDKKALMLRVYNASPSPRKMELSWKSFQPDGLYLSSPFEDKGEKVEAPVELPGFGLLTLRAERPR